MHEFQLGATTLLYVSVCESAAAAKYATVCQIKVTAQPLAASLLARGSKQDESSREQPLAQLASPQMETPLAASLLAGGSKKRKAAMSSR